MGTRNILRVIILIISSGLSIQTNSVDTFIPNKIGMRNIASCMDAIDFSSLQGEVIKAPAAPPSENTFLSDPKKLNELLPESVNSGENGYVVIEKIADKGFQKFISSDQFKSTSLGQLNERVKENTKVELNIKTENQIDHKVSVQLEPFQKGASVGYRGYFGALFSFYDMSRTKRLRIEDTFFTKKLFYENYLSNSDRWDQVGIQWNW